VRLIGGSAQLHPCVLQGCPILTGHYMVLRPLNCFVRSQRAMGEFGAISVISGNIIGRTQTLTLYVEGAYKVRGSPEAVSHMW